MRLLFLLTIILASLDALAQTTIMNIHQNNGTVLQIPINTIDSITYSVVPPFNIATVSTLQVTNISDTSADCVADVSADGGSAVTQRGFCWSVVPNPTTSDDTANEGSGLGVFNRTLPGLSPGLTYHVRSFAINSAGTAYGNELVFTTTTSGNATAYFDTCGTNQIGILVQGLTAAGVTVEVPFSGATIGSFNSFSVVSSGIAGLTAFIQAGSITNSSGSLSFTISGQPTGTGAALFPINICGQSFTLKLTVYAFSPNGSTAAGCGSSGLHNAALPYGTMTDQDGNVYKTIQIGDREWMAENLSTFHFRNGDTIPSPGGFPINDTIPRTDPTSSGNCPYGKVYNYYAVVDPRGLCPTGWHVANDSDWNDLFDFLGCGINAANKMKTTNQSYWQTTGALNSSGFSAVSSPYWQPTYATWWSSSFYSGNNGRGIRMADSQNAIFAPAFPQDGKYQPESVRCVKD